jgi:methylmalonyl-CoA mutase cobalamin-binding subunit
MTDLSAEYKALASYRPTHKVRFVTAASLFDGHDAAINIRKTRRASPSAPIRVAMSSTSSTWWTCSKAAAVNTSRCSAAAAA